MRKSDNEHIDPRLFEQSIRELSRAIWGHLQIESHGGAQIVDGRDRDFILDTVDGKKYIEATCRNDLEKAKQDLPKLKDFVLSERKSGRNCQGYWVTLTEMTPNARSFYKDGGYQKFITAMSADQFRALLIDSRLYFDEREKMQFGSVEDPQTGSIVFNQEPVPQTFFDSEGTQASGGELYDHLKSGQSILMLGPFGSGKSMALREIYFLAKKDFSVGRSTKIPVYLNLRDTKGIRDIDAVLFQHFRSTIGAGDNAMRLLRAKQLMLILDGFDELANPLSGPSDRISEIKRQWLTLVRAVWDEGVKYNFGGMILSGRSNYLSGKELQPCLGGWAKAKRVYADCFTDEQAQIMISRYKHKNGIPSWVPKRPLLLHHLIAHDLLEVTEYPKANAWSQLLDMIALRESKQARTALTSNELLRIMERCGTKSRKYATYSMRVEFADLKSVFHEVTGIDTPDEHQVNHLSRLPLFAGGTDASVGMSFVDEELAEASAASDLARFLSNAPEHRAVVDDYADISQLLASAAIEVCALRINNRQHVAGWMKKGFWSIDEHSPTLRGDALQVCVALNLPLPVDSMERISAVEFVDLDFSSYKHSLMSVSFDTCVFEEIDLSGVEEGNVPDLIDCEIQTLAGVSKSFVDRVSGTKLRGTTIREIPAGTATSQAITKLSLNQNVEIMVICLERLYDQSRTGRKDKALFAGHKAPRSAIERVLEVMRKEGLATEGRQRGDTIWYPTKVGRSRFEAMKRANFKSQDDAIAACMKLDNWKNSSS